MFVEKSGLGPFDGVRISVDAGGRVEVVTGSPRSAKVETALAQICADALGAPLDAIRVFHGRTDQIAYGMGAFASRVTVMAGSATHLAATRLRERALEIGGALLQLRPEALEIERGHIAARCPGRCFDHARRRGARAGARRAVRRRGGSRRGWFHADHMTYPYGLHVAVVRVDPDTGGVRVERCVVAYDIGRAVNPVLVEGQIAGGARRASARCSRSSCTTRTASRWRASFVDYLLATSAEVPPIEALVLEDAPSPLNPLGVKGAGEAASTASARRSRARWTTRSASQARSPGCRSRLAACTRCWPPGAHEPTPAGSRHQQDGMRPATSPHTASLVVLTLSNLGEPHQAMLKSTLKWRVAVDRHRKPDALARFAVDVMAAYPQQRPTIPLQQPANPACRRAASQGRLDHSPSSTAVISGLRRSLRLEPGLDRLADIRKQLIHGLALAGQPGSAGTSAKPPSSAS